ncbi:MAG: glycosyl hydrolase family 18 protein [Bacteroidota bacterium]
MFSIYIKVIAFIFLLTACGPSTKKEDKGNEKFAVIAYYSGNSTLIDSFAVEKLTHIIFSFGHLKAGRLSITNAGDTATIQKLVSLKARNPALKIILSLGGWGGCEFCSEVFATDAGRQAFAGSVRELMAYFKTDGIDLDWNIRY